MLSSLEHRLVHTPSGDLIHKHGMQYNGFSELRKALSPEDIHD